jgi:hypothetical protein
MDMMERGRHKPMRGEEAPAAKLTEQDVRNIRVDERSRADIASDYGISAEHVRVIQLRQSWKHIP